MEQPQWLAAAWAELGQREIAGASDNPRIAALFRDAEKGATRHDEVPWCAAFVGACLERVAVASTRSLMARSYLRWGASAEEGRFGAIAVLSRGRDPAAGHVGFLVGETDGEIILLGGNQSDAVSVAAFPKPRLLGLRWPAQSEGTASPPDAEVFGKALAHVLEMEGGFSDDVHDPGGPTNKGITLKVYADWRGIALNAGSRARLKTELQRISNATVRAIYRKRYWVPAGCPEMAPALALFHFDAAVNHGVTGAIRLLQDAVGTDIDGEIGPLTRAAIARLPAKETLRRYADARRARYRGLPHFWRFGRGWLNRVGATLASARALTAINSTSSQQEGSRDMATTTTPAPKWWGQSVTIWGALLTGLSTVLPALGPVIGIDITADLVREAGEQIVATVQAVGGLIGIAMTIYGRVRATQPLDRRDVTMKL
jgi:uncharacterized protein (TIGR02594 family)